MAALSGVALQGRLQRAAKGGGEALGRRVGASAERRAAGRALHGAGDRLCGGGREKTVERAGGRRKRAGLQFLKISGTKL